MNFFMNLRWFSKSKRMRKSSGADFCNYFYHIFGSNKNSNHVFCVDIIILSLPEVY